MSSVSFPPFLAPLWPAHLGKAHDLRLLSGLGLGQVFAARLGLPQRRVEAIIKISPAKTERQFYEQLAAPLSQQGIAVPRLLWSCAFSPPSGPEASVIVLEKLPELLPPSRWRADPGTLAVLARLHRANLSHPSLRAARWTATMNRGAARLFAKPRQMFAVFEAARHQSSAILAPCHLVSGDPNGSNWGLRPWGQLVLFDWERVGLGSAALDLGAVAYGEPCDEEFAAIARLYLSLRPDLCQSVTALIRDIKIARIFFAAVLLSRHEAKQRILPASVLSYYRSDFVPWAKRAIAF